jgi:alpha-mannosidase
MPGPADANQPRPHSLLIQRRTFLKYGASGVLGASALKLGRGLGLTSASADTASSELIFLIGTYNNSDAEFALAPDGYEQYSTQFPNNVSYVVGTSTPGQDWSYIQPGPRDAWAGSTVHPFTITYNLSSVPAGDPRLEIWYVDTNNAADGAPTVQVTSNGTIVSTTALPGGGGGGYASSSPEVPYALEATIPASTLTTGTNTITITNTAGSWTVYDAVGLLPELVPGAPPEILLQGVMPSVFFTGTTGASQITDVSMINTGNSGEVTFTATTNGAAAKTTVNVPAAGSIQQLGIIPASSTGLATLAVTSSAGGSFQVPLPYQRRWQVYLVHGSHQDIGYTALPPDVDEYQEQYIDTAVATAQATAGYPAEARFRWTMEHAWSLENYVQDRAPAEIQPVAALLQSGQFELGASYDNQLHDLSTSEQMARQMYSGARTLAERFGISINTSVQDDVTGETWQDIQVLSKAGVKYLYLGPNATRAPRPQDPPALFWWQAPNGSRILTWYGSTANGAGGSAYATGYSLDLDGPLSQFSSLADGVASWLSGLETGNYSRTIVAIQMFLDNHAPVTTLPALVAEWNQTYAYPKLILSTPTAFFEAISQLDPDSIPTNSGDWTCWWSDGAGSSAQQTAQNRRAQARTTAAEILGALSSLTTPTDQIRQQTLDQAYRQAELYTEHTWGASHPSFTDAEWPYKQAHAINADNMSSRALASATGDLAAQVLNSSAWPAVAVFNTLSWARSGPVLATVPEGTGGSQAFQLLDGGENAMPYELAPAAAGQITLRFIARDVPPVGYATYQLVPANGSEPSGSGTDPALHADSSGLENQYFRITLNPATGTITSIYDKARGQELADSSSSFQVNQFVYRPNPEGSDKQADDPTSAASQWSPTAATVKVLSSGPVSATVAVTSDTGAGGATTGISALTAHITLYAGIPEVYISDTVDKVEVDTAEEAYFAFPFKVDNPQVTYEVPGTWVRFFTDQLPGSALDWQSIQSYADISGPTGGVTLSSRDAPLVEFDHIRTDEFITRPGRLDGTPDQVDPSQYLPANGSVFSYVYNNLWWTNYRIAQAGTTTFDYRISSHADGFDPVRATHDGWGHLAPLVPMAVPAHQHGAHQPGSHSLVTVDQPNVIVQTIKQSDASAPGLAIRLLEVAGRSCQASLTLPFQAGAATLDDITERPQSALATSGNQVKVPVEAHGIVTLTVLPELVLTVSAPASTPAAPTPAPYRTTDIPFVDVPELPAGQSLPITVTLFNHSHQVQSGSLSLSAAGGLTVSPASSPIANVARGASTSATFTVTAPATASTGDVILTATADVGASVTPAKIVLDVTSAAS